MNQYDTGNLPKDGFSEIKIEPNEENEATLAINNLKKNFMAQNEASSLFGPPKDDSFNGTLGNIMQSFCGKYLYSSRRTGQPCALFNCKESLFYGWK